MSQLYNSALSAERSQKLLFWIFLILIHPVMAQHSSSTIRGTVRDHVSHAPVVGATVILVQPEAETILGSSTDTEGMFTIDNVPVGRQTLRISSIGYEPRQLSGIIVTAGKEVLLTISLLESVAVLNEVEVLANQTDDKGGASNELALASGRSFNIEDTKRYAGSLGDPARMASNFAGVVPGNDFRNDLVVRGNSPTGMLWQLEGLNIPNPTHFGSLGTTGGPVSLLNNNVLEKSDFLTGAFPAQYGNALSGVFDLQMRSGNSQRHEFVGQAGFNGFEAGAEGPLSRKVIQKGRQASYLIHVRYSTLAIFNRLGIDFGTGAAIPYYQDVNAHVVVPTGLKGTLSMFVVGGLSNIEFLGTDVDTTSANLTGAENENSRANFGTGIFGVSYSYTLSKNTFAKLTLGLSGTKELAEDDSISIDRSQAFLSSQDRFRTRRYSGVFQVRQKLNSRNSFYSGVSSDLQTFNLFSRDIFSGGTYDSVRVNVGSSAAVLTQAFAQWRHRISSNWMLTIGMHGQHWSLNHAFALEPRAGLRFYFTRSQSVSLGYGLHSQAQNLYTYYIQTPNLNGTELTNRNLDFTRSHHVVLSYENQLSEHLRLKVDPYYQALYDIPVERKSSSFSLLNSASSFEIPDQDSLVNHGIGRNVGIEVTLEHFFNQGYSFLITTSLFDSNYRGSDGVVRNSAFNTRYVVNVLAGRELKVGKNRRNVLSINVRASSVGGRYTSPLDEDASRRQGRPVFNEMMAYSERQSPYFRSDLRLAFRQELRRQTLEIALDLQNITNQRNVFSQTYNPRTNKIATEYQQGFFPVPQFRYTF